MRHPAGRPASWNSRASATTPDGASSGPLEHQRAPRAERGHALADRLVEREVPRRERGTDADRLAQHELAHAVDARRDHAAVDAAAFLGVPLGVLGAHHHFADGLGDRLALVERHVRADCLRSFAREFGDLPQDLAALHRRRLLPRLERARGAGQREVEVCGRRVRQPADDLVGGRIEDVLFATAFAFDELAVDVQREVFVDARGLRLGGGVGHGGLLSMRTATIPRSGKDANRDAISRPVGLGRLAVFRRTTTTQSRIPEVWPRRNHR